MSITPFSISRTTSLPFRPSSLKPWAVAVTAPLESLARVSVQNGFS